MMLMVRMAAFIGLLVGVMASLSGCYSDEIDGLHLHDPAPVHAFPPVYSRADETHFAVIGDFGSEGNPAYQVSQMVKSWNPEFIITTGDNNYYIGELSTVNANVGQYYCDYIYNPDAPNGYACSGRATTEQFNRFFPCLGNHDCWNAQGCDPMLSYFTLPGNEEDYDYRWGPVHLFALNTGRTGAIDSAQWAWLTLRTSLSRSPHKIVYFHHPPYSTSHHGSNGATQKDFASLGIDAVICGHAHTYERIIRRDQRDLVYFVNGSGGRSLYACDSYPLPDGGNDFDHFCYNYQYGAMLVHADRQQLIFEFYTIDDWDTPIDRYVLQSNKTPASPVAEGD